MNTFSEGCPIEGKRLAVKCARLLDDLKAEQIVVLDLRKLTDVTDFFVIASAQSQRQMRSTALEIIEQAGALTGHAPRVEGLTESLWILIDLIDVVIHLFLPAQREYYDLEILWGDAPKVNWKRARSSP